MRDKFIQKIYSAMTNDRGRRFLQNAQNRWLRRQLKFTFNNCSFYREKFSELGIDYKSIRTVSDLADTGFFTYPDDIREEPFRFLAVPLEEILYPMSSSGTTGKAKIILLTPADWKVATGIVSNGMSLMGMTKADVAQILYCYGTPSWPTGSLIQSGLERLGTFIIPTGNSMPIKKQIEIMRQFGTTALFGTPSYIHRLTEEASKFIDLRSLKVRLIRLGAEPWSETLRKYLMDAWDAKVSDSYGMIELAGVGGSECSVQDGIHISPYLITEVIDPKTGENLPRGEVGELVFTLVFREGTQLIRYRSGDMAKLMPDEICSCKELPTERISRILGRVDDMLFLGTGENTYPSQFEDALVGMDGLTAFQVVINKHGYKDVLTLRLETDNRTEKFKKDVYDRLTEVLPFLQHEIEHSKAVAPLEFEFLDKGILHQESPIKIRHLVDRRD